ncbi:phosphonate ABC transporter ATP-binding protein [Alkalimonas delamerensis]|uniref:Phosphonate ABC transporter ATP-binding protein n=1 Tax=Alkalimonas delamerensis TaxID=265981 RepID=A0ABT9GQK6_9GAMM|nr:phosphonate ABC transporter ATP-binding protein [Alkalimonas delamerensis]MDP4529234.1 phosphonate ABC transporter ATP-binding protein [Alkalimonas delamerensis]
MSVISVRDVHKRFAENHVLKGINLSVQQGEGVILLGANGCGKSTLMRSICGLTPIDSGDIHIQGQSMIKAKRHEVRAMRSQVGVVFQRFNLVGNLSVFQNVLYGALGKERFGLLSCMAPFASQANRDKAMACLERVKLAHKAGEKADQLSGGQQQRVAIARMLMQEPPIVLADEPIASLDPKSGREVMELLWEVTKERGLTVVCTLHHLDVALQYGDRFIGMMDGKVQIDANREQISKEQLESLYIHEKTDEQQQEEAAPALTPAEAVG